MTQMMRSFLYSILYRDYFYFYFRSIRRIIFYSLIKPTINEKGEKEIEPITTSQALQIAGRAGRFSSKYKEGEVTTMNREDLSLLKEILNRRVDPIKVRYNVFITCLWRTVIPSFSRLPDPCFRHLETEISKRKFCAIKLLSRKPYFTALEGPRLGTPSLENGVQVEGPD